MNAAPILNLIAKEINEVRLEVVMIGNAAAALQGAPVTTLDFDFFFRKTQTNMNKLKKLAEALDGVILKPYFPVSDLYRLSNEARGIQLDFLAQAHGIRSFASLRSRANPVEFGGHTLLVASLDDIIKSKKASKRDSDLASLPILEKALGRKENKKTKTSRSKKRK